MTPQSVTTKEPAAEWMVGGGKMGELIRGLNWSETPLGPIEAWPQSLRTTIGLGLASNFPINIIWGPKHTQLYNDGYWPICGGKHPRAMGQDFTECWASAWPAIGPAFERALAGETSFLVDQRMFLDREGYLEETFFTFSFSPIRDESGDIGGLFHPVTETTSKILSERRTRALGHVTAHAGKAQSIADALSKAARALAPHDFDLPFVLLYALDAKGQKAQLLGSAGMATGTIASPALQDIAGPDAFWPMREAVETGGAVEVADLRIKLAGISYGPYSEMADHALLTPIILPGEEHPTAFVITGFSPRLPRDELYRGFHCQVAEAIKAAVANAHAHEAQQQRAEMLAKLDRAKTAFFSNVSHEFRTPLTLMLGPTEELLALPPEDLAGDARTQLEVIHRNSMRLQKLVNTLLDFSRIEAGRIQASYEPTDLAALTTDLVSGFRSAIEKAGMELVVDCPPLSEPALVDRDMWEKIVLNLVSNAFKFTLTGKIQVSQKETSESVQLSVRDTGTGIAAEELARVFERFHRVEGAASRTHEGTGIGLALVEELVKLHGGSVAVESVLGKGSTFSVTIPRGGAHLPADRIGIACEASSTALATDHFVQEAAGWQSSDGVHVSGGEKEREAEPLEPRSAPPHPLAGPHARILLADDNRDMRDYLRRLLSTRYSVEAVANGELALAAARQNLPDLVLSDVMMPQVDGFELIRQLRADPRTREIPVLLLSARAGEEARVAGMESGADDYLIKPFGARELLARVGAHLTLARVRREASASLRESDKRYRFLFNSMDQGFCLAEVLFDAEERPIDYRFLETNASFTRQSGMENAEGRTMREMVPDHEQFWFDLYGQVARTGRPVRDESFAAGLNRWFSFYAFRVGGDDDRRVAIIFSDITASKQAERRADFLLSLSQRLARVTEESDILDITLEALGRQLKADRCYFVECVEPANLLICSRNWVQGTSPTLEGRYQISDFGGMEWWQEYSGGNFAVEDARTHRLTREKAGSYEAVGVRSYAVQPFRQTGTKTTVVAVTDTMPRKWTVEDLGLLEDVVARTWPLIERARSDRALQERVGLAAIRLSIAAALASDDAAPTVLARCMESLLKHLDVAAARIWTLNEAGNSMLVKADAGMGSARKNFPDTIALAEFKIGRAPLALEPLWTSDLVQATGICDAEWARREGVAGVGCYPLVIEGETLGAIAIYARKGFSDAALEELITIAASMAQWLLRRRAEGAVQDQKRLLELHAQSLEQRVTRRTARLQETISELETFSYSISHDLRAPLRAMKSFATILKADCGDQMGPEGQEYIRRIITAAERMDRLIQDVLVYSRVARNEMPVERVELGSFIAGILESYPQFDSKHVSVVIAAPLTAARANPAALTQCVSNLLDNAIKFVKSGVKPHIHIWTEERKEGKVCLFFRDNGVGIPAKMHEKIFGIFYQMDPQQEGTGIGLAVVKKAAERMGGSVGVTSEVGKGSTFYLLLNSARGT